MNRFFLFLIAISPALAIVLYFVFIQQQKLDVKINKQINQQQVEDNSFESDFALAEAEFSDNDKMKKYYLEKAKKYRNKNKKIEDEQKRREKRLKELNKKTETILNNMDNDFKEFDKNTSIKFNKNEFDF